MESEEIGKGKDKEEEGEWSEQTKENDESANEDILCKALSKHH